MAKGPYYSCSLQSREFLLADNIFKGIIPLISPLYITELKVSYLIYSAATRSLLHTI